MTRDLCAGWNVWLGSCQLPKGHKGKHVDENGQPFRATPGVKAK